MSTFSARKLTIVFAVGVLLSACALPPHGSPTPVDTQITWDNYTDPDGAGFFMYWSPGPAPGTYIDSQRVDIGLRDPELLTIKTEIPTAKGTICFRLTAYDAAGNESGYSNEDCGFLGLTAPSNLGVQ